MFASLSAPVDPQYFAETPRHPRKLCSSSKRVSGGLEVHLDSAAVDMHVEAPQEVRVDVHTTDGTRIGSLRYEGHERWIPFELENRRPPRIPCQNQASQGAEQIRLLSAANFG